MPRDGGTEADMTVGSVAPDLIAGRYELRDRIGRGAFGEVFEAYDQRLRRLVALKTLPIEAIADAEATEELRRFHLEARAVARLSHPGIVTVHDFGETPKFAWIVMELVIGETLKAVLDRGERPGLRETVRIVGELLAALHYAHGRGIVHRDVKPANILLAMSAGDGLGDVRLADFGVARMGDSQNTVVGQVVGTPVAMSPEQVRGEEVDPRSDLWAAGVILYHMLTGARPFPGSVPAIFQNILTQDPVAPSQLVPELPPELDAVIATALAKNPNDRYPSAAAMAAALRKAAAPRPLPEILAEADDRTVVMAAPVSLAPSPSPAAPPAANPVHEAPSRKPAESPRPLPHRLLRLPLAAGIFAAGVLCGVFLHRLPDWDITGAAAAGVMAFVAKLEEGHHGENASARPLPAEGGAAFAGAGDKGRLEPVLPAAVSEPPPVPRQPASAIAESTPMHLAPPPAAHEPPAASGAAAPSASELSMTAALEPTPAPVPDATSTAVTADAGSPAPEPVAPLVEEPAAPPAPEAFLPSVMAPADPPIVTPAVLAPQPEPRPVNGLVQCDRERVATRSGSHPGYGRLVFDWTGPIRHEFRPADNGAVLRFPEAGCLPSVEQMSLPRNVRALRPDEDGAGLRIETLPGARIRLHRMEGNRVVVDVLDARG